LAQRSFTNRRKEGQMQADKTLLQMKYARIVRLFADRCGLPYEDALGFFYKSDTYLLMSQGIADLHCRSDEYLADELQLEWERHTPAP